MVLTNSNFDHFGKQQFGVNGKPLASLVCPVKVKV